MTRLCVTLELQPSNYFTKINTLSPKKTWKKQQTHEGHAVTNTKNRKEIENGRKRLQDCWEYIV